MPPISDKTCESAGVCGKAEIEEFAFQWGDYMSSAMYNESDIDTESEHEFVGIVLSGRRFTCGSSTGEEKYTSLCKTALNYLTRRRPLTDLPFSSFFSFSQFLSHESLFI